MMQCIYDDANAFELFTESISTRRFFSDSNSLGYKIFTNFPDAKVLDSYSICDNFASDSCSLV